MANNHYKYNDGSFRDEKIKLIIPLLVKWAQESWDCLVLKKVDS